MIARILPGHGNAIYKEVTEIVNGYAKLLLADGTVKEYQAKEAVYGSISGNTWSNSYPAGTLVKYTLNSSDVITELDDTVTTVGAGEFDANGIYDTKALTSSSVIFSYNGGDADDKDSYEVLKADDLKEAEFTAMEYIEASGNFKAIKVEGISAEESSVALFVSKDATVSGAYVYTALYDGEVTDLKVDDSITQPTTFTTGSAAMYTLTFDSDDVVNKTTAVSGTSVAADVSAATSVSGNVFKDGASASYSLDANIAVYVYDESDDEWAAKSKSALGGRKNAFTSITLVDTDADGDYDIAIVTKP